jgi:hypothetical protein
MIDPIEVAAMNAAIAAGISAGDAVGVQLVQDNVHMFESTAEAAIKQYMPALTRGILAKAIPAYNAAKAKAQAAAAGAQS